MSFVSIINVRSEKCRYFPLYHKFQAFGLKINLNIHSTVFCSLRHFQAWAEQKFILSPGRNRFRN